MKGLVRLKSKLALSGEFMFDCHGSWYKFTTIELWIEHPSAEIPRFELRLRAFLGLKGKARPLEHDGPASAQRVLIILLFRLGGTRLVLHLPRFSASPIFVEKKQGCGPCRPMLKGGI